MRRWRGVLECRLTGKIDGGERIGRIKKHVLNRVARDAVIIQYDTRRSVHLPASACIFSHSAGACIDRFRGSHTRE